MAAVAVSRCVIRVELPESEGRIVRGKRKRTQKSRLDNYREIEIHVEIEIGDRDRNCTHVTT